MITSSTFEHLINFKVSDCINWHQWHTYAYNRFCKNVFHISGIPCTTSLKQCTKRTATYRSSSAVSCLFSLCTDSSSIRAIDRSSLRDSTSSSPAGWSTPSRSRTTLAPASLLFNNLYNWQSPRPTTHSPSTSSNLKKHDCHQLQQQMSSNIWNNVNISRRQNVTCYSTTYTCGCYGCVDVWMFIFVISQTECYVCSQK